MLHSLIGRPERIRLACIAPSQVRWISPNLNIIDEFRRTITLVKTDIAALWGRRIDVSGDVRFLIRFATRSE